jgi:hypothetical protein
VGSRRRRQYVGPDGRDLGIFNLDNKSLFTHDLLDDYTAAFVSSETPFVAYVSVIQKRYLRHRSPKPFVGEAVFRSAWFGYSRLQHLDGDMTCPSCGPAPDTVIWDGVTLAFSRKQLLPSLRPPTAIHPLSPSQENRYFREQNALVDRKLRKSLRDIIEGPSLVIPLNSTNSLTWMEEDEDLELDMENDTERQANMRKKHINGIMHRIQALPATYTALKSINPDLGELFNIRFGITAIAKGAWPSKTYIRLFKQVGSQFWFISWSILLKVNLRLQHQNQSCK